MKAVKNYLIYALFVSAIVLALFSAFVCLDCPSAHANEEDGVLLELTKPIIVKPPEDQSRNSQAVFADLQEDAVKLGLDRISIMGSISYKKKGTKKINSKDVDFYVVNITWHSLASDSKTESISPPLKSALQTGDKRIEVGQEVWARGHLQALKSALQRLKTEKKKQDSPQIKEEDTDTSSTGSTVSDLGSGNSGSWWDSSDSGSSSSDSKEATTTAAVNTLVEPCPDFVDENVLKVFEQTKKTVGTTAGVCTNTGTEYKIQKETGICGIQFDFETGKAYKMEQWYYLRGTGGNQTEGGQTQKINIGGCRKSETDYSLYETENSCTPTITEDQVIPLYRMAYKNSEGNEKFASECAAKDGEPIALQVEYCGYDHDKINNVSYATGRKYYVKNDEKIYVGECLRLTDKSFPHEFEETGWAMNDDEKYGQIMAKRFFFLNATKKQFVSNDSEPHGVPIAYLVNATFEKKFQTAKNANFTAPASGTYNLTLIGSGDATGYSSNGFFKNTFVYLSADTDYLIEIGRNSTNTKIFQDSQLIASSEGGHNDSGPPYIVNNTPNGFQGATGYTNYPTLDGYETAKSPYYELLSGSWGWYSCSARPNGAGYGGGFGSLVCNTAEISRSDKFKYHPGIGGSGFFEALWMAIKYVRPDGSIYSE